MHDHHPLSLSLGFTRRATPDIQPRCALLRERIAPDNYGHSPCKSERETKKLAARFIDHPHILRSQSPPLYSICSSSVAKLLYGPGQVGYAGGEEVLSLQLLTQYFECGLRVLLDEAPH